MYVALCKSIIHYNFDCTFFFQVSVKIRIYYYRINLWFLIYIKIKLYLIPKKMDLIFISISCGILKLFIVEHYLFRIRKRNKFFFKLKESFFSQYIKYIYHYIIYFFFKITGQLSCKYSQISINVVDLLSMHKICERSLGFFTAYSSIIARNQ